MTVNAIVGPVRRATPFLFAFALLLLSAATAAADTVRVLVEGALVWTRPQSSGTVVTQIARGTSLDVIRRAGDWFEIVVPVMPNVTARSGYIRAAQVEVVSTGPMSAEAQRIASLNQRNPPPAANTQRTPPPAGGTGRPAPGGRPAPRPTGARAGAAVAKQRFLSVDFGYRLGSKDFTRRASAFADSYAEEGSITTNYGKGKGPQLDVMASQAMWGNIGIGFGVSFFSRTEDTTIHAEVPHPFFFNQLRGADATVDAPKGTELGLHIPIVYVVKADDALKVIIYGGPSIYRLSQDVVADLTLDDPYPHDQVGISDFSTESRTGTVFGFHVGGDVSHFLTKNLGVGGGVRYSSAKIKFKDDEGTTEGTAGGLEVSGGVRIRF